MSSSFTQNSLEQGRLLGKMDVAGVKPGHVYSLKQRG